MPSALLVVAIGALPPSRASRAQSVHEETEFFEKNVRPLLVEKCWPCHGDAKKLKGGLSLTSRANIIKGGESGPAALSGDPAGSLLVQAVRYDQELKMPPKGKLTDREIEVLSRWVAMKLPWPETAVATAKTAGAARELNPEAKSRFWSFRPIHAGAVPAVRDPLQTQSPIDGFLQADLEKSGLSPAEPADRRTLIRRATFDLIGLPPKPEDIDAFLSDQSPQAFARVVDRLLASPHYGERWGRHWLDVVRYADARDLIQLPADSDFRESWRYRDWVVAAFNRDLPYTEFIRYQIAGDLLPPPPSQGINKDGIVATGMLAIADFVPGDVDKDQMIADYVNDQIDVVSKAFLGVSVACARCHDHKFDPISIEDYYALAGIFFSTRLIPGPVAGNTPLVRVPLLSPEELKTIEAQDSADKRRRAELEQRLPDAADRAYVDFLRHLITDRTAAYLVAASESRRLTTGGSRASLAALARERSLNEKLLAGFVNYLDRVAGQPSIDRHKLVRDAAAGTVRGSRLKEPAAILERELAALATRRSKDVASSPDDSSLEHACLIRLRADDAHLLADGGGRVLVWPNRGSLPADARPQSPARGPLKTTASINGHDRAVLKFDGESLLAFPRQVPPKGSLLVIYRMDARARSAERLLGWEDSDTGKHGLGLMLESGGKLHAILRNDGRSGDLVDSRQSAGFELVCLTWGPQGVTLHRNGASAGAGKGIDAISSDQAIAALKLGGPGSGGGSRFQGELAEVRVYDRQLTESERGKVEEELRGAWLEPSAPKARTHRRTRRALRRTTVGERPVLAERKRADGHASLGRAIAPGTNEAGARGPQEKAASRDSPRRRGARRRPQGHAARRLQGCPCVLAWKLETAREGRAARGSSRLARRGAAPLGITSGSGRLELARWIARSDNPLTARVMVNRIWQHHFGEALVGTPNDFGERGERPTNPALLDWLAARFVDSGWSVKAMHRAIMTSSAYQQSSRARAALLAKDPDNRLFGRMTRRRLDAEAIRDSLLAVAGRLNCMMGGTSFADLAVSRRTVYLQSVRTGPGATDFGRVFDRADPGSIVGKRGESVVAPQALFFLNDPFVNEIARAVAARIASEVTAAGEPRIGRLYAVALGRPPTREEMELGSRFLARRAGDREWERYCQLIICQNEFLYID